MIRRKIIMAKLKEYEVYCNGKRVRYVGSGTNHPETIKATTKKIAQHKAVAACHRGEIVGNITIKEV
jgi:hypothetical protein